MFEIVDGNIKKMFIRLFISSIFFFFLGIVLRMTISIFFALGILVSVISGLLLARDLKKSIYEGHGRVKIFINYTKRYALYALALYLTYLVSEKFYFNHIEYNFLACSLGLLSLNIYLYLQQLFLKK